MYLSRQGKMCLRDCPVTEVFKASEKKKKKKKKQKTKNKKKKKKKKKKKTMRDRHADRQYSQTVAHFALAPNMRSRHDLR